MSKKRKKYLEFLSKDDVQKVHTTSLAVLEETGVRVLHEEALKRFADAGAKVDSDNQLARIPGGIVEEWIQKAPGSFTVYAKDDEHNLHLTDGVVNYVTTHGLPNVYDLDSGKRRPSTCKDAEHFSKLSDSLEFLADAYCVVHPQDVPDHAAHAHIVKAQIENSIKPIKGRINGKTVAKDCIKMAAMVAGGLEKLKKDLTCMR